MSDDFRYLLERTTSPDEPKRLCFVGVNPSTATDEVDDPTVRKLIGFTRLLGFGGFRLVNCFARRSTDPRQLYRLAFEQGQDIVGADNMACIKHHAQWAHVVIPCWGSRFKLHQDLRPQLDHVRQALESLGVPMGHFGRTKSGDPKHPLMLPYNTAVRGWYDDR